MAGTDIETRRKLRETDDRRSRWGSFAMSVGGRRCDKRTDVAEALGEWVLARMTFRPPRCAERDAGVAAHIAGHGMQVVEGTGIMENIDGSPVRSHIDGVPGVLVETTRERAMHPNVVLVTKLENRITELPKAVT